MAALPQLASLSLEFTDVTDAGLKQLARLPKLTELNISGTRVTAEGVAKFRTDFPSVEVTWAPPLDEKAHAAARELRKRGWYVALDSSDGLAVPLVSIAPPSNYEVGDRAGLQRAQFLASGVSRSDRDRLPSDEELSLIHTLPRLDALIPGFSPWPQDDGLPWPLEEGRPPESTKNLLASFTRLPNLEGVKFFFDYELSDDVLLQLADIKTVKRIKSWECSNLTAEGIERFRKLRPDVELNAELYAQSIDSGSNRAVGATPRLILHPPRGKGKRRRARRAYAPALAVAVCAAKNAANRAISSILKSFPAGH